MFCGASLKMSRLAWFLSVWMVGCPPPVHRRAVAPPSACPEHCSGSRWCSSESPDEPQLPLWMHERSDSVAGAVVFTVVSICKGSFCTKNKPTRGWEDRGGVSQLRLFALWWKEKVRVLLIYIQDLLNKHNVRMFFFYLCVCLFFEDWAAKS